jgi:hypothetical protein
LTSNTILLSSERLQRRRTIDRDGAAAAQATRTTVSRPERCYRLAVGSLAGLSLASRTFQLLGLIGAMVTLAFGCQGSSTTFLTRLDEARRLAADLHVHFEEAADASNRAVMADTDEASITFASDAEKTVLLIEGDVAALAPQLRSFGYPDEIRLLEEFGTHFAEYRNLDREILKLAVENTNLKAQRLSFGPAREAADGLRDALGAIPPTAAPKDRCRVEGLVAKAMLAVRETQVIQAPHIAESDDAAMTRMEKEMADLGGVARDAIKALTEVVPPSAQTLIDAALLGLDRFNDVSSQIVALSRRNSNVRSLDLSLRQKPPLTAACDGSLRALEGALAAEGSKATR